MRKTFSFKELCEQYQGKNEGFVEITDRQSALNDLASKTSCCWGAGHKFGETGWIQLCSPSIPSKGCIRTIFVCKASLIA